MKHIVRAACAAALMSTVPTLSVSAAELSIGDDAPGFELIGSDGETYNLDDFNGKQAVMLAWYPKAFTGG